MIAVPSQLNIMQRGKVKQDKEGPMKEKIIICYASSQKADDRRRKRADCDRASGEDMSERTLSVVVSSAEKIALPGLKDVRKQSL